MTRSKNAAKTKDAAEMGHDLNDVITIDTIKSISQEMFQQQEKVLIETVNSASLVTNRRIDKLSTDITDNNEKLIKLANDVSDVQLSIEAFFCFCLFFFISHQCNCTLYIAEQKRYSIFYSVVKKLLTKLVFYLDWKLKWIVYIW